MRIAVFGILPFSDLIKEGFKELGHEISNKDPDLIYANDPVGYQNAVFLKNQYPKVHLILNVLDIPWHFPNIEKQFEVLKKRFLNQADIITAISQKVKKDLNKFFDKNISEKIEVIYNPTKDVYFDEKIQKDNIFLFVGRANDPVKRFYLVRDSLNKINDGTNNIKICGQENPGFGNYLGYVSDVELNKLYNSTKYVLLPSKAEGIGLPMIEALICGSIPITCSDNETAKEFLPIDFICEPNPQAIVNKIEELSKKYKVKRELAFKLGKKYRDKFNKISIAKNILSLKKMIYVSLSTIPQRIKNLNKSVESLLNQSHKPDKIFINVPLKYKRFPEIIENDQIPRFDNNIVEITRCEDCGPGTKLLGSLNKLNKNSLIILADDDNIYEDYMIEKFYYFYSVAPENSYSFYVHPLGNFGIGQGADGFAINTNHLAGIKKFYDIVVKDYKELFLYDDLWISYFLYYFKKNKILSLQKHLRKSNDGKPTLIYKTYIEASGLISLYGNNLRESVKKRDQIAAESFKYMMEKTKNLNF